MTTLIGNKKENKLKVCFQAEFPSAPCPLSLSGIEAVCGMELSQCGVDIASVLSTKASA